MNIQKKIELGIPLTAEEDNILEQNGAYDEWIKTGKFWQSPITQAVGDVATVPLKPVADVAAGVTRKSGEILSDFGQTLNQLAQQQTGIPIADMAQKKRDAGVENTNIIDLLVATKLKKQAEQASQAGLNEGFIKDTLQTVGSAVPVALEYSGIGNITKLRSLPLMSSVGAIESASRGENPIKGAASGAAMAGIGRVAQFAPKIVRPLATAAGFGGLSVAEQVISGEKINPKSVAQSAIVGGLLDMAGMFEKRGVPKEVAMEMAKKQIAQQAVQESQPPKLVIPSKEGIIVGETIPQNQPQVIDYRQQFYPDAKEVPLNVTEPELMQKPVDLSKAIVPETAPQTPTDIQKSTISTVPDQTTAVAPEPPMVNKNKESMPVGTKFKPATGAYQDWVNVNQSVENLDTFAKENNIDIKNELNPKLAIRLKKGSVGAASSILENGTFRFTPEGEYIKTGEGFSSIIKDYDRNSTIKDKKIRTGTIDKYLQDMRTVQDLQDGRATPEQSDSAWKRLNDLEKSNPKEYEHLGRTADRLYAFQKNVLRMLIESGNISQESYDKIVEKNKFYVPFERIFPDMESSGTASGKVKPKPKKVIFKMRGSERDVENTLESIVKKTYQIVDSAQQNIVNRSIAQFADLPGIEGNITKVKQPNVPTHVTANEVASGIELPEQAGNIEDIHIFRPRRSDLKKNQIISYENGKPTVYQLSDPLYQAFKSTDPASSNILIRLMKAGTRMLRVGATATPDFALRNMIRDQSGAMVQTKVKFTPFIDSLSAVADIIGKKDIYHEYLASGAHMQSYADLNRTSLGKTLNYLRGHKSAIEHLNIITKLEDFSALLEQATRIGTFKAAKKVGQTTREAGYTSRESTLDFARSGEKGKKANEYIAFLNAGFQSVDKIARSMRSDPVGFTTKAFVSVTIPEILFQILNKDDPEYKKIPRWQKDMFWIMPEIPGIGRIRIPKPFTIGQMFGSVPGRFMEYVITKDKHAFDGIINTILESVSPVGMDAVGGVIPTLGKPFIENAMNHNFFTQTNVYPEYKAKLEPEERYNKYTSETFKEIGKLLKISPAKAENVFGGVTGTLGRYAVQASDFLINSIKGESEGKRPMETADIPIVRGFVTRSPKSFPETLNVFYRAFEEIDNANSQLKKYVDADKMDEAEKYIDKHPEIGYRSEFLEYRNMINEANKGIDAVIKSKIKTDEKKKRIGYYEDVRNDLLDEILKKYSGKVKLLSMPKTTEGIFK